MSTAGERLPYPGLRSFTREETDIFFGREGCVDDMVDRLAATRFLAVLGASGSGKSSLVKTGLLDALEIGLLHQAGSRWMIAEFRPGDRPIFNLAEGLLRASSANPTEPPPEEEIKLFRAFLARGPRSVVEWCSENLPEGTNLLLLVDQFEELFRYGAYAEREEAEAFVSLLLESARAPLGEARIYVAITMRSEFLGAAALIDGLAEAINKGLYLTPRMSREQVKDAVAGPAAVCGFEIEPALVNRLLNDLTSFAPWEDDTGHQLERLVRRADQLPLMQHVLNRLWSLAAARPHSGAVVLQLADYEALGGLRGALAAHGREILEELLPEHREIAGAVFRALTAGSSLAEAVRRPTEFGELVEISGGDEIAVREIVEAFRAPGRNFLVPPRPAALRPDTLIDISHESLIRQWDEFAHWLQREITSADTWRRLVDAAERYKRGEANLISGLTLASIANWWDTERPTAAWAKRYGGDFRGAADFLAESRRTETAEKDKEAEDRRQKARNRLVTWAAVVILCVITPLTVFAGYSAIRANREADAAEQARVEARTAAEAERQSAAEARQLAEQQRLAAEAARKAELQAAEERQRAEAEATRADEERTRALAAQQEAMQQAAAAEVERRRADEERTRAVAAQQEAMQQAAVAVAERQRAEDERKRALAAEQAALQAAALARAETERADQERQRAEHARMEFRRANLQQLAGRVASLQQEGSWDTAANLLAALWQQLIGPDDERRQNWLITPIVEALARQRMAEFPVFPDFLNYSGYSGWTGTTGRFRIYALDRKAEDGTAIAGNKIIAIFDAASGAVLGSFELPAGNDLGSKTDLVSHDGSRVAIVTDKSDIALWAIGQPAPTLIPVPDLGGEVGVSQLASVNSDARFALYLTLDEIPNEFVVVDPATQTISFTVTTAEIMEKLGLARVDDVKLLGFVDDRLIMLVNKADGQVVTIETRDGAIGVIETGAGVKSAALTQDGALLLTLTCPGSCIEQHLTAFDVRLNTPLWVERVPNGMALSEEAISEIVVDGKPTYSALVEQEGSGIVFQFSKSDSEVAERFDGGSHARIGSISFDAKGGFRTVESASGTTSSDGLSAAAILANYHIPVSRQKLSLYVAPNSVAIYQSEDTVRIAGVSYDGDLLVYRQRADGEFENDVAFRPVPIAESNCLNSVAFGGDGKSLLFRHIDGSLLYVAAVGQGANIGWQRPDDAPSDQGSVGLSESAPAFTCERPETAENEVEEKIVAVGAEGDKFALLDKTGTVWWAEAVSPADETGPGQAPAEGTASLPTAREFAVLERAGTGMRWISGDPERGRAALVSGSAVEIVQKGETVADTATDTRGEASAEADAAARSEAAAVGQDRSRKQKVVRWADPRAAAFGPNGDLVVAYGGGQVTKFRQSANDTWIIDFDGTFAMPRVAGLFFTTDRIAVADDREVVVAFDSRTGALQGYTHVPANPSALALRPEGSMLSLEWDTDSVAFVEFSDLTSSAGATDAARLVTMRSLLDEETDTSLTSLTFDRNMEQSLAVAAADASVVDCSAEARHRLLRLEDQLLGVASEATPATTTDCRAAASSAAFDAAETLARRMPGASVRELVEDDAFSRLLQAAAAGDAAASRLLGAVLARIAIERGELDTTVIAEETLRFGANLPAAILKNIAVGAPISPTLLDLARQRSGPDPAAHQLVAHSSERSINDVDSLTEALREFSIAERLYRAGGRADEARFVGHRRAQLSRLLPDDRVLSVAEAVENWSPETPDVAPQGGALADLPGEPSARRTLDMENANRLAERVPDSLLLDALRTEMERARIVDLRTEDPQAAADLLIDLGRRTDAASGWSPDLVREYLDLAEDIRDGAAAPSAFRLAAEAMRMIGAAFKTPIHDNAEASGLFSRAADLISSTVASAERNDVAAGVKDIDLSLLTYRYGVLPGADATEASQTGRDILQATARMAEAVAGNVDDPKAWNLLRGVSLFWQGVLVNDHDTPSAVPILKASVEALRPAVEADPQNLEARFRLAEALRWVGLAETSSEETTAFEREAVSEYQKIWKDDPKLASDFAADVGVGYGFALANLARTMRETNLADLSDGKTAEDHAGWVLEILALAAEKDDVNTTMIETGAATQDSTFVDGWYRMSSYGWAIGFLSGLANVESGAGPVTQCDVVAADPYDPLRRAPGVETVSADAESLCRTESDGNPNDARALFQLARAISTDSSRESEYVQIARIAAESGVSPAFSLVASSMSGDVEDHSSEAYLAASQHTISESFPVLYPYFVTRATTERERQGLAWYARKAAALGVREGHVALADSSTDPLERLFHFELAARLADEAGDTAAAATFRERAGAIPARKADQQRIEGEVTGWTPEPLVELPAGPDSS